MEQLKAQEKASGEKEGRKLQAPLASSPSRTGAAFFVFFDGMAGSWWRGAGPREGRGAKHGGAQVDGREQLREEHGGGVSLVLE
jgi:hypothetical protein